jgi:hypothetical protein
VKETELDWLEDDGRNGSAPSAGRPRALLVLAALPWLVVIALIVRPGSASVSVGGRDGSSDLAAGSALEHPDGFVEESPASDPGAASEPVPLVASASDDPGLELTEIRGRWRVAPGPEEATALAVVVARAWLTGLEPRLEVEGIEPAPGELYAEHLVVEAVEQASPEAAVVTLLAIVLDGGDDLRTAVRRLAVPIAFERDGPRPAGPPWWLPGPQLEPLDPERMPLETPEDLLAASQAIQAAGFDDVQLHGVWRTSGWPVIAEVTGTAPDGSRLDGPVWLRRHLDGFVVAGTPMSRSSGRVGPVEQPAEEEERP